MFRKYLFEEKKDPIKFILVLWRNIGFSLGFDIATLKNLVSRMKLSIFI